MTFTFYDKLKDLFKNMNIRKKLLLSYLILVIFPMVIISYLTYTRSSDVIQKQVMKSTELTLKQTARTLEFNIRKMIETSNMVFSNQKINKILSRRIDDYPLEEQFDDLDFLEEATKNAQDDREVFRIRLYVQDGLIYSNQNENIFNIDTIKNSKIYTKASNLKGGNFLTEPLISSIKNEKIEIISVVRMMMDLENYDRSIGAIFVDIPMTELQTIISEGMGEESGDIGLVDESGKLFLRKPGVSTGIGNKEMTSILEKNHSDNGWNNILINRNRYIVGQFPIAQTPWKLVSIIPLRIILTETDSLLRYMTWLLFLTGIISYLLSEIMSRSNTKRIYNLINTMKLVEAGDFNIKIKSDSKDEIGHMELSFNLMLDKIDSLLKEQYKMGFEVKNLELKALREQINPHFLYNTLDLIKWMAVKHGVSDIETLTTKLGRFYRISLSGGMDCISIRDELAHAKLYFSILSIRYNGALSIELDIEDEVYDYSIPKIVLQPLIENSVVHGIMKKEDKKGYIKICARKCKEDIIISIYDNGIGMTKNQMVDILTKQATAEGGYGVKNIHERIRLTYGDMYGLVYTSQIGQGTSVELAIPAIKYE